MKFMIFIYLLISTAGFRDAVMDLIKQNIKKKLMGRHLQRGVVLHWPVFCPIFSSGLFCPPQNVLYLSVKEMIMLVS